MTPDMGTNHFFSIRFNSVSESFDSDSTHDLQWLSKIESNELTTQNGFMDFHNFDPNQLDSKNFPEF